MPHRYAIKIVYHRRTLCRLQAATLAQAEVKAMVYLEDHCTDGLALIWDRGARRLCSRLRMKSLV